MQWWKKLGLKIACLTSFPYPIRKVINTSSLDIIVNKGKNVTIANSCLFSGNISLGNDVYIGPQARLVGDIKIREGVELQHYNNIINGDVEIGEYTYFTSDCHVHGEVLIGKYCAFGPKTSIWEENHRISGPSQGNRVKEMYINNPNIHEGKDPISIGHDVWAGNGATILPGTNIGSGAVIGAGSIVTKDVEPYSIVAGNPAQRIGWRFNDQIRRELLDLKWWNWSQDEISEHSRFFSSDLTQYDSIYDILDDDRAAPT